MWKKAGIDGVTAWTTRSVSRRRFLGHVGKAGAVLGGVLVGGNLVTVSVAKAATAPAVTCPPPCTGVCSDKSSACITGGQKCTYVCSNPGACTPTTAEAYGYWVKVINGPCVFHCSIENC